MQLVISKIYLMSVKEIDEVLEVCMGMGIPIPMRSHGNGSSLGLLMGMGIAYCIREK